MADPNLDNYRFRSGMVRDRVRFMDKDRRFEPDTVPTQYTGLLSCAHRRVANGYTQTCYEGHMCYRFT